MSVTISPQACIGLVEKKGKALVEGTNRQEIITVNGSGRALSS